MNSAWQKKSERSDPRFKAPPPSDNWWRQPTGGLREKQAERKRREARLIHIPPKTMLVVDDGSSATFYCRCGRRARQTPSDASGIEFRCRKHGWVATWREERP